MDTWIILGYIPREIINHAGYVNVSLRPSRSSVHLLTGYRNKITKTWSNTSKVVVVKKNKIIKFRFSLFHVLFFITLILFCNILVYK